jgi:hypothetical protein
VKSNFFVLCNYEIPPLLMPPLSLATSTATVSSALPTSASAATSSLVVVVPIVVVHLVPTVAAVTPLALQRWAGRVATAPVAALAECAKGADLSSIDHYLRLCVLLLLLHFENEDGVALAVPPSARIDIYVVDLVVVLDDGCSAHTLPFEALHLRCAPIKLVLGHTFFSCISCTTSL